MDKELNKVKLPYLTTPYLLKLYSGQKYPRDKIKNLHAKGELIHLKQGLYLLGEEYGHPYSKEVLAGMIYGPSAISFEYALSYYGLIPERVEAVTSTCFKRNKKFCTPIGDFIYRYVAPEIFPLATNYIQTPEGNFFMATPERALCDIAQDANLRSDEEALDFVLGSLRVDEDEALKLNALLLHELGKAYRRRSVNNLVDALMSLQNKKRN